MIENLKLTNFGKENHFSAHLDCSDFLKMRIDFKILVDHLIENFRNCFFGELSSFETLIVLIGGQSPKIFQKFRLFGNSTSYFWYLRCSNQTYLKQAETFEPYFWIKALTIEINQVVGILSPFEFWTLWVTIESVLFIRFLRNCCHRLKLDQALCRTNLISIGLFFMAKLKLKFGRSFHVEKYNNVFLHNLNILHKHVCSMTLKLAKEL